MISLKKKQLKISDSSNKRYGFGKNKRSKLCSVKERESKFKIFPAVFYMQLNPPRTLMNKKK